MNEYTIYTDGACIGNPGPGGWGAIVFSMTYKRKKEISGNEPDTTNNRMELTAVIKAIEMTQEGSKVDIFSDSQYIVKAYQDNWIKGWRESGYKQTKSGNLKNPDLWEKLDSLVLARQCSFYWVKGHVGDPNNERCDFLATRAAELLLPGPPDLTGFTEDPPLIEDKSGRLMNKVRFPEINDPHVLEKIKTLPMETKRVTNALCRGYYDQENQIIYQVDENNDLTTNVFTVAKEVTAEEEQKNNQTLVHMDGLIKSMLEANHAECGSMAFCKYCTCSKTSCAVSPVYGRRPHRSSKRMTPRL